MYFWKDGGHGMTQNKSVGWHTHHHASKSRPATHPAARRFLRVIGAAARAEAGRKATERRHARRGERGGAGGTVEKQRGDEARASAAAVGRHGRSRRTVRGIRSPSSGSSCSSARRRWPAAPRWYLKHFFLEICHIFLEILRTFTGIFLRLLRSEYSFSVGGTFLS